MLYTASQSELVALINALNPGSNLKDDDVVFTIQSQDANGTTVEVTAAKDKGYYGDQFITYRKRDLAKSVLGVPVRVAASTNTTVRALIEAFAVKYGYTFDETIDFTNATLSTEVDMSDVGFRIIEIPAADSSLVWLGTLTLLVGNTDFDLANIIVNRKLTNFPYLSGSGSTGSISTVTYAGNLTSLASTIDAMAVGSKMSADTAASITSLLTRQRLVSNAPDNLTAALTNQPMLSKTLYVEDWWALFGKATDNADWAGGAYIKYAKADPLAITPPASGTNDFEAGTTAVTINIPFVVNRPFNDLKIDAVVTGATYATLTVPTLVFQSATEKTSTYVAQLKIAAAGQTGGDVVTVAVSIGGTTLATYKVNIKVPTKDPDNNIYEFVMGSGNAIIKLGTGVKATINWGDGETTSTTGAETSHTYSSTPSKPLVVTVDASTVKAGNIHFFGGNAYQKVNKWMNYAVSGVQFGELTVTRSCTNLTTVPAKIPPSWTTMNSLFYGCSKFNDPNVKTWDTSNITDFTNVFRSCALFNQDISNWNTAKVTNMTTAFYSANAFAQDISKWNMGAVTTFYGCFANAAKFNSPLNTWNVSKATDMTQMFSASPLFNQPLDKWNTANVTVISQMFANTAVFNQNLSGWNTSKMKTRTNYDSNAKAWVTANKPIFVV